MRAKFNKGLKTLESIVLKLPISASNERQTKDDFAAFIDMINRANKTGLRVQSLEVDLSCYLQRHYVGDVGAKNWREKWLLENECYLKQLKIPYKIVLWNDLINADGFKECEIRVNKLYQTDSTFQVIVNNLAKQHSHKADHESAKNYLLEECAVFLNMQGHVTYPSPSLNAAVTYVLEKFNSTLQFHSYMLYVEPEKRASQSHRSIENISDDELLLATCLRASELMRRKGILTYNKQVGFFSAFLKLAEEYKDTEVVIGEVDNEVRQQTYSSPVQQFT